MEIKKTVNGENVVLEVVGRIDSTTASSLEASVNEACAEAKHLSLDFKEVEYISSAGLRVLLKAQKDMTGKGGSLEIYHVSDDVLEVFDMTGFSSFLTIKD